MSSSDRGRSWQPLVGADRPRLTWPTPETRYSGSGASSPGQVPVTRANERRAP